MKITLDQLPSFCTCGRYKDREYVLSLTGGRNEIEVEEISELQIPERDKIWLLLKILNTLPDARHRRWLFDLECSKRCRYPLEYAIYYNKPPEEDQRWQVKKLLEYIGV